MVPKYILPVIVIGFSALNPSLQSMLSLSSSADEQGSVLGTGQGQSQPREVRVRTKSRDHQHRSAKGLHRRRDCHNAQHPQLDHRGDAQPRRVRSGKGPSIYDVSKELTPPILFFFNLLNSLIYTTVHVFLLVDDLSPNTPVVQYFSNMIRSNKKC